MENRVASSSRPPDVPAILKNLYMNLNTITSPEPDNLQSAIDFLAGANPLNVESLELPEFGYMNLLKQSQPLQPLPQTKETFENGTFSETQRSHLEPLVKSGLQLLNEWELAFNNYQGINRKWKLSPIYQETEQDQLIHGGREKINEDNRVAGSDDPDPVEIAYAHMDDLAPDKHLAAPLMEFYIRYLQKQTSLKTDGCLFLFLDTQFYNKLHAVVSSKQNDTGTLFVNLRTSLKDANIFQKAYVLIPIHEDYHWSLAIICIPDREDISGPIILHLNSSRQVFDNFKRFLIKEWEYLKQESVCSEDIPIASEVRMKLDEKIEEEIIAVPKSSAVDSGPFVLHLMKRFIDEAMEKAPKRLKKSDMTKFGRKRVLSRDASNLRETIRTLLENEFHKL